MVKQRGSFGGVHLVMLATGIVLTRIDGSLRGSNGGWPAQPWQF